MYLLLFIIGVLTRNIWKLLLHGFEFQVYDLFIDINMINWEKILIGLGKNIFPAPCLPAFLGNRGKKHLLLRMSRPVNITTDLLICGLLKPGILKCRHSSALFSSLLRVLTKAACESCGGEQGSTPVSPAEVSGQSWGTHFLMEHMGSTISHKQCLSYKRNHACSPAREPVSYPRNHSICKLVFI